MAGRGGSERKGRTTPGELLGLLDAVPADLTDGEVTVGLLDLIELSGRVNAAAARYAASFDARSLPSVDGARTTGGWLAARTEFSRPAAGAALACGRGLRHCPEVDAAAGDGRLGAAKVRLMLDARKDVEELFSLHEADLVDQISPFTVDQARRYLASWRAVALATTGVEDPDPAADSDRDQIHLSSTFEGRWRLDGDLHNLAGEALAEALDQWIDSRVREGVIDPTTTKRSTLRARALTELVGLGAHSSAPRSQPHTDVRLVWDAADMLGQPVADLTALAHRRCLTDGGHQISQSAAAQSLCNADITDLLVHFGLDGATTVLGATHTRRRATTRERSALSERDQGCVFPGCDAPVKWCDAHHTVPYEIGRRTRLDELVLLCPHHHRQVHQGFTLTRTSVGQIQVTRPDGTRLDPIPPDGQVCPDRRHKLPPPTRFKPPPGGALAA